MTEKFLQMPFLS